MSGRGQEPVGVFAGPAAAPANNGAGYSFGTENSWIRIQNIGDADANLEINYFDADGNLATTDVCPSQWCPPLYPGSGWTFFQQYNPNFPPGFQGSAVVNTDQPIVALVAKDTWRNGHFSIAGDTVEPGAGSQRIYLPAMSKRATGDWNGRFVIQNMSDSVTACVGITYLSAASDSEVASEPSGKEDGCPNGGIPISPRGSLFRAPDSMPVDDGFLGSVRIEVYKNGKGQGPEKQFISAIADTWNEYLASFSSSHGFDESELGTETVLPLIDRQVGPANSYSTRFQIVNKTPSKPADVTLFVKGYDLSSGQPVHVQKENSFTVNAAKACWQNADDESNCLAPGDALPFNFVGTIRLESSQPLAVVVLRGTTLNETFTDYRGIRPADGSYRVLLPVLNKSFGPVAGVGDGWGSWFRVMVADGGYANVKVTYYGLDLEGGSAGYSLAANREFTVFQYNEGILPNGFAGTAIIESDRPIVALANIFTDIFTGDDDVLYNGISLDK
ncbi:MAG TPA: hypothetical protein VI759_03085 [Dehalococcoidia bacterium]|nr:hypothetical protein [Dehalococcoidia bacterium]